MVTAVAVNLPSIGRPLQASALALGLVEQAYVVATPLAPGLGGRAVTAQNRAGFLGCPHAGLALLAVFSLLGIMSSSRRLIAGGGAAAVVGRLDRTEGRP